MKRNERWATLKEKVAARRASVTVIGAGYVGLTTAVGAADAGFRVVCLEADQERVQAINEGRSYVEGIKSATLAALVSNGRLRATGKAEALSRADVVLICVPTPLNAGHEPDLSYVEQATQAIAGHSAAGRLIILESTTYPGTTDEVVRPRLESSGLRAESDFWLAFSPERVDPGNKSFGLHNTPKIVGGVGPLSTRLAVGFFQAMVQKVVPVSSAAVAEMVKIYENVFRNVNIAFANEAAMLCDRIGIDVWEVIEAAATKPFGFVPFYPGPGMGGHCIPVDPHYLAWRARQFDFHVKFIELAASINADMPYYVCGKVTSALNDQGKSVRGSSVLVLGVAYKRDIADVRESPALKVIPLLERAGARVTYHDPYVPRLVVNGTKAMRSVPLTAKRLREVDCALLLTDHSCFPYEILLEHAPLIVDTRNALRARGLLVGMEPKVVTLYTPESNGKIGHGRIGLLIASKPPGSKAAAKKKNGRVNGGSLSHHRGRRIHRVAPGASSRTPGRPRKNPG